MSRRETSKNRKVIGPYVALNPDPLVPQLMGLEDARDGDPTAVCELYAQLANGLGILHAPDREILRDALINLSLGVATERAFMPATRRPRGLKLGRKRNERERTIERYNAAVDMLWIIKARSCSVNAAAKQLSKSGRSVPYLTKAYNEFREAAEIRMNDLLEMSKYPSYDQSA